MDTNTVFKGFDDLCVSPHHDRSQSSFHSLSVNMEELDNAFIAAVRDPIPRRHLRLTPRSFTPQYKVNSLGPVHSITAFLPLLRASNTKKIVVIGSCGGDIKTILALGIANTCAYAMSKAATAVAATKFGLQLKDEGFVTVTLDPGIVNISATAPDSAFTAVLSMLMP